MKQHSGFTKYYHKDMVSPGVEAFWFHKILPDNMVSDCLTQAADECLIGTNKVKENQILVGPATIVTANREGLQTVPYLE